MVLYGGGGGGGGEFGLPALEVGQSKKGVDMNIGALKVPHCNGTGCSLMKLEGSGDRGVWEMLHR
jgi:hypothetical protein